MRLRVILVLSGILLGLAARYVASWWAPTKPAAQQASKEAEKPDP